MTQEKWKTVKNRRKKDEDKRRNQNNTKKRKKKKKTSFYFYLDHNVLEHTHLTTRKTKNQRK